MAPHMSAVRRGAALARPLLRQPSPFLTAATGSRTYAISRTRSDRETSRMMRSGPKEPPMSTGYKEAARSMYRDGGSPLFPATFVAVSLSRYPRTLSGLFQYQTARTLSWLGGKLTVFGNRLESMGGWTSRPRYKPRTGQIPTVAKAMYREVLEAFAAGDVATIERLCVPAYAQKMLAAVGKRDPREEVSFEVVKWHQPWRFPKLKSHQIRAANEFEQHVLTEQAVVALASTQRVTRRNRATGEIIPGSSKVQEKTEFVVLARNVDKKTWEMSPWRVWGTTYDTPLDRYLEDKAKVEELQDKQINFENSPNR